MKYKIFQGNIPVEKLDRETFSFAHNLSTNKTLELDNILKILPSYPKEKITYSENIKSIQENLDYVVDNEKKIDFSKVKDVLIGGEALIAIRNFELHDEIQPIFKDIVHDIGLIMKSNGTGSEPLDPHLWLFIASPNAKTPYHLDRSSNFILQIRGSKELAVFPPRDERVMKKIEYEKYMDWNGPCPSHDNSFDHLGFKHRFSAGNAAHIPFISGHYVKNGSEDISITISVFFNTNETKTWTNAMRFNNRLRKFKINSSPVGQSQNYDSLKSFLFTSIDKIRSAIKK